MGKLELAQARQHIGLVLGSVPGGFEQVAARRSVVFDAGIVAGGHAVVAQGQGLFQKFPEFQRLVAENAGVGRPARLI